MTKKPGPAGWIYSSLILLFLYAPIFVLIAFSFNSSKSRSVWTGFSLYWYGNLISDSPTLNAFYTTIAVSLIAAIVATVAGTFAAIGLSNMRKRWRAPLMQINNIPLVNADIITGVSMSLLFVAIGSILKFELGFGTLLIAHITFNIPYVILSIMPKLRQLDNNLVDAACDLGCTWIQAFWKVTIPEIMPGIINGMIIAFTLSVDDFVISYFTAGKNATTLSMKVYSMTRKHVSPEINALSTIMFLTVLILLIVTNVREIKQEERQKRTKLKGE